MRRLRSGARLAALIAIDRLQVGGERPGRIRIAGVVVFQEKIEREIEAALGETAGAAMTRSATVSKQPGGRFALIDILCVCRCAGQHSDDAKGEQSAPRFLQRDQFRKVPD